MKLGMVCICTSVDTCNAYNFSYLGTKNVAKSLKKIAVGTKKTEGKTWFSQLSDKSKLFYMSMYTHNDIVLFHVGKSIKTSLYWAMKNCGGDAQYLQQLIINISQHYQVCST